MTLIEFVSLAAIPVSLLSMVTLVFVGVAVATKKNRLKTINVIQAKDLEVARLSSLA